jgi:hypothetical protein
MSVTWCLPDATRIAGTVDMPASARLWGDCEVVIEVMAAGRVRPLWRHRLNESTPEAAFNLELPGGSDLQWTVARGGRERPDSGSCGASSGADQVMRGRIIASATW